MLTKCYSFTVFQGKRDLSEEELRGWFDDIINTLNGAVNQVLPHVPAIIDLVNVLNGKRDINFWNFVNAMGKQLASKYPLVLTNVK